MFTFLFDYIAAISIALVAVLALSVLLSALWIIAEDESGLVIKRFGPPLASGRILALDGEAGYQARLLPPESLGAAMGAGIRFVAMSPTIRTILFRAFVFGLAGDQGTGKSTTAKMAMAAITPAIIASA